MIYWTKRTSSNVVVLVTGIVGALLALWILGSSAKILMSAAALAYLTHPLAVWLERRGIGRGLAISSVFIVATIGLVFSMMALIPFLASEIQSLIMSLPGVIQNLSERIKALSLEWNIPMPFEPAQVLTYLQEHLSEFLQSLSVSVWQSAKTFLSNSIAGILWLLNMFLFPVFYFYLMTDYEKISKWIQDCIPPAMRSRFRRFGIRIEEILSGYIRGQFLVCMVQAGVYSIGLSALDIRYGILIGLIGGLLTLIPYVGFSIVVVGSVVMALTLGATLSTYLGLVVLFAFAQALESYVLTPRLVGQRVGLGPLGTLLALIAGANIGGLFGMVVAVPCGGIIKVIAQDAWETYRRSSMYQDT